jgi:hypothetical protein
VLLPLNARVSAARSTAARRRPFARNGAGGRAFADGRGHCMIAVGDVPHSRRPDDNTHRESVDDSGVQLTMQRQSTKTHAVYGWIHIAKVPWLAEGRSRVVSGDG